MVKAAPKWCSSVLRPAPIDRNRRGCGGGDQAVTDALSFFENV